MIKLIIICFFLIINSCSSFKKDVVYCPKVITPKKAAEVLVNSENNSLVYIGFRGVKTYCIKDKDNIEMEISVNVRVIRKEINSEDSVPVKISVVSTDMNNKEYDRDSFKYSHFLLKGSKIVDRVTTFDIKIPKNGQIFLGIR